MRIYLASTYSRRPELVGCWADLVRAGHEMVSTWVDGHHEKPGRVVDNGNGFNATDDEINGWASEDVYDVGRCECLILFSGGGRGGRHAEFGMALAAGRRLIVVGPREHVFHYLSRVEQYDTFAEALAALS